MCSPASSSSPNPFRILDNQTYALCAVASCFVFNEVAYCKCDVETGDSISLTFKFDDQDVCDVNEEGMGNGYMVSTFSVPDSVLKTNPNADMATYTCPGTSDGAYAQCDGGICSTSTQGQSFPGFDEPLAKDEIICSCPITPHVPGPVGYQIAGPYPCQQSFFENCKRKTANKNTGSTLYVGAPTGTGDLVAFLLTGSVPPSYKCSLRRDSLWRLIRHDDGAGGGKDAAGTAAGGILAPGGLGGGGTARIWRTLSSQRVPGRTYERLAALGVERQSAAGGGVALGDETAGLAARGTKPRSEGHLRAFRRR
jgi:hypothetical protein